MSERMRDDGPPERGTKQKPGRKAPRTAAHFQNRELEATLLGGLLVDDREWPHCLSVGLARETFYDEIHRTLFDAFTAEYNEVGAIEIILVSERLRAAGELDMVGGATYIASLMDYPDNIQRITTYATRLIELEKARDVATVTYNALLSFEETPVRDIPEGLTTLSHTIKTLSCKGQLGSVQRVGDIAEGAIDHLDKVSSGEIAPGVMTGIEVIDELMNGLHRGHSIVVAGDPKHGKSSLVWNIAWDIAVAAEKVQPVGFISMEMKATALLFRAMGRRADIPYHYLTKGRYTAEQYKDISAVVQLVKNKPLWVASAEKGERYTIDMIRAKAQFMKEAYDIQFLAIDYLQLIRQRPRSRKSSFEHVEECSGELKSLAAELNIPLMLISSVNREGIKTRKEGGRLGGSHLRGSQQIAYDCDALITIERQISEEECDQFGEIYTVIRIASNRHGPSGHGHTLFRKRTMEFIPCGLEEEGRQHAESMMELSRYNKTMGSKSGKKKGKKDAGAKDGDGKGGGDVGGGDNKSKVGDSLFPEG